MSVSLQARQQVSTLDNVTVLTYSDRVTWGLCASMLSAARNGFELQVFGVDEASFKSFHGDPKMKKLFGMQELLQNQTMLRQLGIDDDSTLMFSDASDVIFLGSIAEAAKRFQATVNQHGEHTVLVAAERNCWPYMAGKTERIPGGRSSCANFPDQNSTFMYLNSGAYIGRVKALRELIASAYDTLTVTLDDQMSLHQLYALQLAGSMKHSAGFKIVLDSEAQLFQTGWGTNLEGDKYAQHENHGAFFELDSRRVFNTEHNSKPFLVHFNGGKTALKPITHVLLAQAVPDAVQQMKAVLTWYVSKYDWFTAECTSIDAFALLQAATAESDFQVPTNETSAELSPETPEKVATHGFGHLDSKVGKHTLDILANSSTVQHRRNGNRCPPGYPVNHLKSVDHRDCALQFFKSALHDIESLASNKSISVSIPKMHQLVKKWPRQLGLFALSKNTDHRASWKYISGQGLSFWSTKPFHIFMSRHANTLSSSLVPGGVAYFVINGFDEPAVTGQCPRLKQLAALHPNVNAGLFGASEGVPVWSMSKVRGCHMDLLIPHPDIFAKFSRAAEMKSLGNLTWSQRKDKVVFRGSTTGMGDEHSNLRVKAIRELFHLPDFDVGIHAAIQTIQEGSIQDIMKPKLSVAEWASHRYAMDIDGNAHSFNRPLAIARAGCTMLRVNIFTDLFDDGLLSGTHAFDVDPSNIRRDAEQVLKRIRSMPDRGEDAAMLLTATHEWLTEDVLVDYMQKAIEIYTRSVKYVK